MLTKACHVKRSYKFSFIIVTKDNFEEFERTLFSIKHEAPTNSEIVIVDGSEKCMTKDVVEQKLGNLNFDVCCISDEKQGIFNAMNVGVNNSSGEWLIMLTAGDYLKKGAKSLFDIIVKSKNDVLVFAQDVEVKLNKIGFSYFPSENTIWPHQSVVLKRTVHESVGLYPVDEKLKFTAEQYLFQEIRKVCQFEVRNEIFSVFCLGGLSSGTSVLKSGEYYNRKRELGSSKFNAFVSAYLLANLRFLLERNEIMANLAVLLRVLFFSYYKWPNKKNT
jgi:glycosyltransferase involved in cell wall biosynthesis